MTEGKGFWDFALVINTRKYISKTAFSSKTFFLSDCHRNLPAMRFDINKLLLLFLFLFTQIGLNQKLMKKKTLSRQNAFNISYLEHLHTCLLE